LSNIVIGTRGSPLALWQANWVKDRIEEQNQGLSVTLTIIHTTGDKILDTPLAMVGGKGLFVKEIETALINREVDLAVHSMKDVPTKLPDELEISVIAEREDPRDAFIAREIESFDQLPKGAKVGTSSLRRQAMILNRRPDLKIIPLRGNVGTRLRKLTEEKLDAIILAAAGLKRMEQENEITEYMDIKDSLPAVAQGALGIETRKGDDKTLALINFLNHTDTRMAVEAERAFLEKLEGGCQVPIAAYATLTGDIITLDGLVGAVDGSVLHRKKMSANVDERKKLGVDLAEIILDMGAGKILKELYGSE
jgi:hydroxymethylbilane synthase